MVVGQCPEQFPIGTCDKEHGSRVPEKIFKRSERFIVPSLTTHAASITVLSDSYPNLSTSCQTSNSDWFLLTERATIFEGYIREKTA